jgi:XXXCH domain-containing protein
MSNKGLKSERILEADELERLVGVLNDVMRFDADAGITPDGFKKIKMSVAFEFGRAMAKVKVSLPSADKDAPEHECIAPGDELMKYSKLKKRMKKSFKAIQAPLDQGQLPPEEAVSAFLAESDMMICYPGYGDEFYLDYIKDCRALAKAWEKQDLDALRDAAAKLGERKAQCHEKYKK